MPSAAVATSAVDQELRDKLAVQPPAIAEWINLLVYGDAGAGKTYLIGTAEEHKELTPVLVIDVEGGLTTIRNRKIDTKPIRSMKELEEIHATLYHSIKDGKMYYKTVAIDSLTELASLDMRIIMKEAYQRNPEKVDIDVPSPREWGKCREHMRLIVRAFRDLPCNVVYTASAGEDQPEGQPKKYFPAFAGKLRMDIPGFMDIVGYLTTKNDSGEIIRNMQLLGTNRVVAKDRTASLGDMLQNPTLPLMWDTMKGNLAKNGTG